VIVLIFLLCTLIALLGAPLFAVFGMVASAGLRFGEGADPDVIAAIASDMYGNLTRTPVMSTIPLFTFAGYLLAESKGPQRIVALARACFGWMPGGLALVTLITSAYFTSFTGGSGVTIIAVGGLLYPILREEGYSEKFSLGLVTCSGSVGLLFPPSLPIVLFGTVGRVDIDRLFLAGLAPGGLILLLLGSYCVYIGVRDKIPTRPFNFEATRKAIWDAKWELPLLPVLMYLFYTGKLSVAETAAFTALYVFVVECLILRDVSLTKDLPRIIKESMTLVGAIFVIICVSWGFNNYLADAQVPEKLLHFMQRGISSQITFLLVLNVFLLIIGSLKDVYSAILVVVPLIMPMAKQFGVNPVHLGIIFLANLEIGYLLPPVGMNLVIASFRFKRPIVELYQATTPFIILSLAALGIITYVPALTLGALAILVKLFSARAAAPSALPDL
jgi:tripartite ATP-independent transporter DctM subunit